MREKSQAHPGARICAAAGLTGALILAAGCASAPLAPTAALDAAKVAISGAERADASHYAGAELGEARQKLDQAENAVAREDMVGAERLADQARVEAELASARTGAAKAVAVNKELSRGAEALTEEMQRAGGQQ